VTDRSDFPVWFPHLTLGYSIASLTDGEVAERVGPITFDRVAVSYGSEQTTEIPLGGEPMTASTKHRRRVQVNVPDRFRTAAQAARRKPSRQNYATLDELLEDAPGGGLPENYRPATSDDVPDGQACGNCVFFTAGEQDGDGNVWCSWWEGWVMANFYCNAWQSETALTADAAPARWEGVLAVEGAATGDGRLMEPGSLRWDTLPIPLRDAPTDEGEHRGAVVVGRIVEVWRDGMEIRARGDFDLESYAGREAARKVANGLKQGVSVDLDDVDLEVRVAAEVAERFGMPEWPEEGGEGSDLNVDSDGRVTVAELDADDEMLVTTDGRIRAATIVDIPAFVEARIVPTDGEGQMQTASRKDKDDDYLAAGAASAGAPADWFDDPRFGSSPAKDPRLVTGPDGQVGCPITVTDDGRVFGHLALWGTCHTAFANECVSPPRSETGYAYFRTGVVRSSDGSEIPVGRLTVDTMHAGRRLSAADTSAHYEHSGLAVADVSCGEDEHGVWVAGSIRPGASDEQVAALRSSPLSGDWRRVGGNLELVAALAVNSPGFPVPRALVAGGTVSTLQRATALTRQPAGSEDDGVLRRIIDRERQAEADRRRKADTARRRVLVASAASRIRAGR